MRARACVIPACVPNYTLHLGKYVEVVNGERSLRPGALPFPPARLSHRAGLIRKRTRFPAGRLLSAEYNKAENNRCQCPSSPQALPEKLIERRARANSRASRLLAPASCPESVVAAGQRVRRVSTTWSLQQCDPVTRCTEIPIGCQIAIRLAGRSTPRPIIARAFICIGKNPCPFWAFHCPRGGDAAEVEIPLSGR